MISRSGIEEANKHIQALNARIQELEGIVKEQKDAMVAKDSFIQTKIQELMAQDRRIKDLTNSLKAAREEIMNQDLKIVTLNGNISAKDLQILHLQSYNEKMKDLASFIPDLNAVIEKINAAHKEVIDDITDSKRQETPSDTNSAVDNGTTENYFGDEGSDIEIKTHQFSEMVQTLAKTERTQKFSISEDDIDENSINGAPFAKSPGKEFYL